MKEKGPKQTAVIIGAMIVVLAAIIFIVRQMSTPTETIAPPGDKPGSAPGIAQSAGAKEKMQRIDRGGEKGVR